MKQFLLRSMFFLVPFLLPSCASLRFENVDFGWPVESVLDVGDDGRVEERRYAVAFDVTPLAVAEFEDSTALRGKKVRILRSTQGYYFITGKGFRNVYVLSPGEAMLTQHSRIPIIEKPDEGEAPGMQNPAMNQRPPHVELIDGSLRLLLTPDGFAEGENP